MTKSQIIALQKAVGTLPDGFWGVKSIAATQAYLTRLMPSPSPWPKSEPTNLRVFYGQSCDEDQLVLWPVPVPMFYNGKKVKTIRCHHKVAESLGRALTDAYEDNPKVVEIYDGCYNCRNIAGSNTISLHARGAAIDLSAFNNGSKDHWPTSSNMPLGVMEAFAKEGWVSAGAFWGRDAMHFEATKGRQ